MRPTIPGSGVPVALIIQRQRQDREREIARDWSRPRPELPLHQDYLHDEQWIYPPAREQAD